MKSAIYIEDGVVQLVITPENDFEKNMLASFSDKLLEVKVFSGSFYDCREGWVRQSNYDEPYRFGGRDHNDKSLILRIADKRKLSENTNEKV